MKFFIYTLILFFLNLNSYSTIVDTIIASEENNDTYLWLGKNNYEKIDTISERITKHYKDFDGPIRIIITDKVPFKNYLPLFKSLEISLNIHVYYIDDFKNYKSPDTLGYYSFRYKSYYDMSLEEKNKKNP